MTKRFTILIALLAALFATLASTPLTRADIFQWEYIDPANPNLGRQQSTTLAPDGAGAVAAPSANLSTRNLTKAYLVGAALHETPIWGGEFGDEIIGYLPANLAGVNLSQADLTNASLSVANLNGANLSNANLTNVYFNYAVLSGANLTDAEVRGANFYFAGITPTQLYTTASYQVRDLSGIHLQGNVLTGANLIGVNLTDANFQGATLTSANLTSANLTNANFSGNMFFWGGADLSGVNLSHANLANVSFAGNQDSPGADLTAANLTGADARGANFYRTRLEGVVTTNMVNGDGHIAGLNLTAGAKFVVRDYDGNPAAHPPIGALPIVIEQAMTTSVSGKLRMEFDADAWGSTISFAPDIPVALGGTLELAIAAGIDPVAQVGRTFDLFNWDGVNPTGSFAVSSEYSWDLTKLYTTGEVTLTGTVIPGDFNGDHVVDAADLAKWKGDFGQNGDSDAHNDGDSDGADFLIWQRQLGVGLKASRTVPEPKTMLLIGPALIVGMSRRADRVAQLRLIVLHGQHVIGAFGDDRLGELGQELVDDLRIELRS